MNFQNYRRDFDLPSAPENPEQTLFIEDLSGFSGSEKGREEFLRQPGNDAPDFSLDIAAPPQPEKKTSIFAQAYRAEAEAAKHRSPEDGDYKTKIDKLLGAAKRTGITVVPEKKPAETAKAQEAQPFTYNEFEDNDGDIMHESRFSQMCGELESEGIDIKVYVPQPRSAAPQQVNTARLAMLTLLWLYAVFAVQLGGVYAVWESMLALGINFYLYAAAALLAVPAFGLLYFAADPGAKGKARINARAVMFNAMLLFTYLFLALIAVNLIIKFSFENNAEIIRRIVLPAILAFDIVIGAGIYVLLHNRAVSQGRG